jgi:asparagine synthetase B (glutamine-hydrolysing)
MVLTKMDRASMANSLEVRLPFLKKEICEKMLSLDPENVF